MQGARWIAAEWNGARLTLWAMGADGPVARGEAAAPDLAGALAPWGGQRLPILAAGLPGAPVCALPCRPEQPAQARRGGSDLWHVPDLARPGTAERLPGPAALRLAGLLAAQPEFDGVACLTGPHSHWTHLSAGEVVSVMAAASGRVAACLAADPGAEAGFDAALSAVLSRPERLARALAEMTEPGAIWGALIGAELAAARPWWLGQRVLVLGEGATPALYARALGAQGVPATTGADEAAALAGFTRAATALGLA